ncbi:hypothetical protein BH23ACT5_BH23ACT5_11420 [soil metagenome]
MTSTRTSLRLVTVAVIVGAFAMPAGAQVELLEQYEHESWDGEAVDGSWAEAIEAVREAHPHLRDLRNLDLINTRRVRGFLGRGLEVTIPQGGFRGFGPYARLAQPADEAWYRYHIRLTGFYPAGSGKLPGLADASLSSSAKGCIPSTSGAPGWSARHMFERVGTHGAGLHEVPIGVYLYHLGQAGGCGDEIMFNAALQQHRWTCIEGHVRMNTPGQSNGLFEAWVDGEKVATVTELEFRRPSETHIKVREMWDNVYFGGSYPTPNQLRMVYDQVVVSSSNRVGCVDPFLDDNNSQHEGAFTELHARGLFFGCDDRMACPYDRLTRAEFAAMLHRLLSPPPGPNAFIDDDGHWGESVLDSLAAAGIMRGCNPPANTRACPDAPVSRAEVAALVRRAVVLPPGPDAFDDDNGHWAEADIDAIAAAGVTRGCNDGSGYCPNATMLRQEAATFMLRVDDLRTTIQPLSAPALPEWPPPGPPAEVPLDEREWNGPVD